MESFYLLMNLLANEAKLHLYRAKNSSGHGNVIEYVLMLVASVAIAGIVYAAVTSFVTGKVAHLK